MIRKKAEWASHQIDFIRKEWEITASLQLFIKDESTDHIHVIISTEETKTQRFKNRYGEGEKKLLL